jgi:hypothetical protein
MVLSLNQYSISHPDSACCQFVQGVFDRLFSDCRIVQFAGCCERSRTVWCSWLQGGIELSSSLRRAKPNVDDHEPWCVTSARCSLQFGNILRRAEAAALVKSGPVVVFGEMVAVLWAQKKYDAAIRLEELWNELSLACSFYLCCAYPASGFGGTLKGEPCATICAQHSEVVSAF